MVSILNLDYWLREEFTINKDMIGQFDEEGQITYEELIKKFKEPRYRVLDGIIGTWVMLLVGNTAYLAHKNERTISASIYTTMAGFVYLGEIYGAWRTAKYDQLPEQKSFHPLN